MRRPGVLEHLITVRYIPVLFIVNTSVVYIKFQTPAYSFMLYYSTDLTSKKVVICTLFMFPCNNATQAVMIYNISYDKYFAQAIFFMSIFIMAI